MPVRHKESIVFFLRLGNLLSRNILFFYHFTAHIFLSPQLDYLTHSL